MIKSLTFLTMITAITVYPRYLSSASGIVFRAYRPHTVVDATVIKIKSPFLKRKIRALEEELLKERLKQEREKLFILK